MAQVIFRRTKVMSPLDFTKARLMLQAPLLKVRKQAPVAARKAKQEVVVHTLWNGKETSNTARPGDWIVTALDTSGRVLMDKDGNCNVYIITDDYFRSIYDHMGGDRFQSKIIVDAFKLPGPFEILAPWGEVQRGSAGYLMTSNGSVYANHEDTFNATYTIVNKID